MIQQQSKIYRPLVWQHCWHRFFGILYFWGWGPGIFMGGLEVIGGCLDMWETLDEGGGCWQCILCKESNVKNLVFKEIYNNILTQNQSNTKQISIIQYNFTKLIHNNNKINIYKKMDQNIDLTKIKCIPHHQMLAISNQYMIGCVDHINKVADFAQKQMLDIDALIDNLDNQVLILQAKLGIVGQISSQQQAEQVKNM